MIVGSFDIVACMLVAATVAYGALRGLRPALYLLVLFLLSLLAVLVTMVPLERLVMDLAGVDRSLALESPAVPLLLLENRNAAAFVASVIPGFLVAFLSLVFFLGELLLRRWIVPARRNWLLRLSGAVLGFFAGTAVVVLVALQAIRLPYSGVVAFLDPSILLSWIEETLPTLLPALTSGL